MPPLKYWKIKEYLEEVAVRPESATRMPTVRELMSQFNVSLATVNRALTELENDGVIIRRQGSGIVAAGSSNRAVKRLDSSADQGNILFAYNDYPDESIWNMVHTVGQYSRQLKCNMVDCKLHPDSSTEDLIDFVRSQANCLGLILMVGADRLDGERLEALGSLPMKVVLVDSMFFYANYLPDNIYVLSPDASASAQTIIRELLAKGHRKIGYIRNEPRSEFNDQHIKSLTNALRGNGADLPPEQIFSSMIRPWENSLDAAIQQTRNNLGVIRELGITALIYSSSIGALVSIKVLQEAGLRVPEDISVIAGGNRSLYDYLVPGLTVTSTNANEIGRAAVDIVLSRRNEKNHNIFFPPKLIVRASVKDISQNGEMK